MGIHVFSQKQETQGTTVPKIPAGKGGNVYAKESPRRDEGGREQLCFRHRSDHSAAPNVYLACMYLELSLVHKLFPRDGSRGTFFLWHTILLLFS